MNSIDNVIDALEAIIIECENNNDPLGYFAVLYQKVTKKVKEGIEAGFFDDGPRMERLDVIFAKRYIDAYHAFRGGQPVTASWQRAFLLSSSYWPTVIQHLFMGINAHINLDLGIVAAEISRERHEDISALEGDFNKISDILSSLVDEVQQSLYYIYPFLRGMLRLAGKVDNLLIDFRMKIARTGAWKYALSLFSGTPEEIEPSIATRDEKVARIGDLITEPGFFAKITLGIIRLVERGSIAQKIEYLKTSEN